MPGWLKLLIGIAIAIPVGFLAFVWYLENAFESGGCRRSGVAQGVVSGDIGYEIQRLRCNGLDDEFAVTVGPSDGRIAAISTMKLVPKFVRAESERRVLFAVDGRDLVVTLDGLGQPIERIDVDRNGRTTATPHPR